MSIESRAKEIAKFLCMPEGAALAKLSQGFLPLHAEVTADFRRANPRTDAELLEWYRTTEAYIWELSAYHEDAGFNYSGQCEGIVTTLLARGCRSVLCLGDGVGDLTLAAHQSGLEARYHDLEDSRTAAFAAFRFWRATRQHILRDLTSTFAPDFRGDLEYDAVASLDFLEHVVNVEEWVRAIHAALKPGGFFVAQNAFNCGSGPDGAIPQHLACNDRFEKDWDPLLTEVGFEQLGPQWYQRPA